MHLRSMISLILYHMGDLCYKLHLSPQMYQWLMNKSATLDKEHKIWK